METPVIVQNGAPVLRKKAKVVPEELFGTKKLSNMLANMAAALDREPDGVALAAPQIGILFRIFIIRHDRTLQTKRTKRNESGALEPATEMKPDIGIYINPEFVRRSRRKAEREEGCLSVRGFYGKTKRHERATVRAYDENGNRFERGGGGILAQIFEHEIEHLNGMLFIEHATDVVAVPKNERVSGSNETFLFFGTPAVARDTLALIAERGFVPAVVITAPDAPRGRGLALTSSETKAWAGGRGIPILTPSKLDSVAQEAIRKYGCSYAVVVAYGKILPGALIDAFPKGVLNVHYSLLPKYRGASPVEAALLHGDAVTGVAVQKMVRELDAGDIVAVRQVPIAPYETAKELRPRLIRVGAELLAETLPAYLRGEITPTPQDHAKAARCGKIEKSERELSLAGDPETNWNKYRAYAEPPGVHFFAERNGKRIRVKITKASRSPSGEFFVERVIPEGKREMAYADFARV